MNLQSRLEAEEAEAERLIQYLSQQGAANQELSDDDNTQEETSALQEAQNTENKPSALQEIKEEKQTEVVAQKENIVEEFAETSEEDPAKNDAYWENKYKILQGKYDAETKRERTLTKMERTKNAQLTAYTQEIQAELKQKCEELERYKAKLLELEASNDSTAGYEPELFQAMRNDVAREFGLEKPKVQQNKPELRQKPAFSKDEAFDIIYELVGSKEKFQSIENDPKFISWLHSIDPLTGVIRYDTMINAFEAGQLEVASNYHREFDRALQKERSLDAAANKRQLDSLQAPRSKGDSSPVVKEKDDAVYDYELTEHERKVISGKYSFDELEKAQARIDRAIKNGAVIPTRSSR